MAKIRNNSLVNIQQEIIDSGLDPKLYSGLNGENDFQTKPKYIKTSSERVFEGGSNARIVLGKDRNGSIESGYGGLGEKGSGSIDIVAEPVLSLFDKTSEKQFCNPDFKFDAARVYLAGKTNIDEYFGVEDSKSLSKSRAGAAVFADCTRIFARQDVRIVSGLDKKNAAGGTIYQTYGIQIVGNNDFSNLQPAVLGKNLSEFGREVTEVLDGILSLIDNMILLQSQFNKVLASHTHYSPFMGNPTTPSEQAVSNYATIAPKMMGDLKSSLIMIRNKIASISNNYLSNFGGNSILSDHIEIN